MEVVLRVSPGKQNVGFFHLPCLGVAFQAMDVYPNSADRFFQQENKGRPFVIKPISSPLMKPLLVFVNPKSGGNQVSHFS